MRLVGTAAAALVLIAPAASAYELAVGSEVLSAKDAPAPSDKQAPPPAPNGCPFRDGKLELIA